MCTYLDTIVGPYFDNQKKKLGLAPDHECILQLDVWSVHRGQEFTTWIKASHPYIIRDYVPGGCTGIFQPCDVGIQRLFKLAIRRAQHEDMVHDTVRQLEAGVLPTHIKLDINVGHLRERSVRWLVEAYHAINKPEIVKKVCL